jgi:hypothetical protein
MIPVLGKTYRSHRGELFKIEEVSDTHVAVRMLNPDNKDETDFLMEGPRRNFKGLMESLKAEEIDLAAHVPTGLVALTSELA